MSDIMRMSSQQEESETEAAVERMHERLKQIGLGPKNRNLSSPQLHSAAHAHAQAQGATLSQSLFSRPPSSAKRHAQPPTIDTIFAMHNEADTSPSASTTNSSGYACLSHNLHTTAL